MNVQFVKVHFRKKFSENYSYIGRLNDFYELNKKYKCVISFLDHFHPKKGMGVGNFSLYFYIEEGAYATKFFLF